MPNRGRGGGEHSLSAHQLGAPATDGALLTALACSIVVGRALHWVQKGVGELSKVGA